MSGGHFDYNCFRISEFADELKDEIDTNEEKDEFGDARNYSTETLEHLIDCHEVIALAGKLARKVEWLYSGDSGEEDFNKATDKIMEEVL